MGEIPCTRCGSGLRTDHHGLCARCLLSVALEDADLPTGDSFGNYEPLAVLGEGGMGVVYLAEQKAPLRRLVALKVLKANRESGAVAERFQREFQTLALMDHPNIAMIFDAGASAQGVPYFAMEYVEGATFTAYCDQARLNVPARLTLFHQVCQAVDHAHQRGILHRDLKPSNIVVTVKEGRPQVKVIDFGLARLQDWHAFGREQLTGAAQIVGTPEFMSPEQAAGSDSAVGRPADVYSLGTILYELVAGVLPFDAAEWGDRGVAEILHVICDVQPPVPSRRYARLPREQAAAIAEARSCTPASLRRMLSGDLDAIVSKAIEKSPALRYESAGALAEDLERYRAHQPVRANRGRGVDRLRKWSLRHRGVVWGSLCTVCMVGAAALISVNRNPSQPLVAAVVPYTTADGTQSMPSFSPDGKSLVYVWDGPDGDNYDLYLASSAGASPRRLTTAPEKDVSPAWSPKGDTIAFQRAIGPSDSQLMLLEVASGKERELTRLHNWYTPYNRNLSWSPDGRWLAVLQHESGKRFGRPFLFSLSTGELRPASSVPDDAEYIHPQFSPDGRSLIFVRDDRYSDTMFRQRLTADHHPEGGPERINALSYCLFPSILTSGAILFQSPGSERRRIWWIPRAGARPEALEQFGDGVASFAVSANGSRIAVARREQDIEMWHYRLAGNGSGQGPMPVAVSRAEESFPAISPDGREVAFVSNRSGSRQVWISGIDGGGLRVVASSDHVSRGPHWLRDNRTIRFGSRAGEVRKAFLADTAAGEPARFEQDDHYIQHTSADGRILYYYSGTGNQEKLYRAPADSSSPPVQVNSRPTFHAAFDPGDQWLYYLSQPSGDEANLCRIPLGGGPEQVLQRKVLTIDLGATTAGVYYARQLAGRRYGVYRVDARTGVEALLFETDKRPFRRISVSDDGKDLVMDVAKTDGMHISVADIGHW